MRADIVLLPGDGIGPEIIAEAEKVIHEIARIFSHDFNLSFGEIGGCAIDKYGDPLPDSTLEPCKKADAILLGAVGGPKWDDPNAKTRPEVGLLKIRKELGLFANLRPIKPHTTLIDASPLKREIIEGVDILFVRELTGGVYFGDSELREEDGEQVAINEMIYRTSEVERVVRVAAKAAMARGKYLTSVDKANVLEVSRLWRRAAQNVVSQQYSELKYDVVLVDAMAMHLITRPRDFDVVVTGNLFGDILTDEASVLPGSLGLLPSASLGESGPGLYEPIHGSAPDIAGKGIANPLATILATAMMFQHSLGLSQEAELIEKAVEQVLDAGHRTADIASDTESISTTEMATKVIEAINSLA